MGIIIILLSSFFYHVTTPLTYIHIYMRKNAYVYLPVSFKDAQNKYNRQMFKIITANRYIYFFFNLLGPHGMISQKSNTPLDNVLLSLQSLTLNIKMVTSPLSRGARRIPERDAWRVTSDDPNTAFFNTFYVIALKSSETNTVECTISNFASRKRIIIYQHTFFVSRHDTLCPCNVYSTCLSELRYTQSYNVVDNTIRKSTEHCKRIKNLTIPKLYFVRCTK